MCVSQEVGRSASCDVGVSCLARALLSVVVSTSSCCAGVCGGRSFCGPGRVCRGGDVEPVCPVDSGTGVVACGGGSSDQRSCVERAGCLLRGRCGLPWVECQSAVGEKEEACGLRCQSSCFTGLSQVGGSRGCAQCGQTFGGGALGGGQRSDCRTPGEVGCESGKEELFNNVVSPEVEEVSGGAEKVESSGVSGVGFEFAGVVYSTKLERNRARRQAAKLKKAGRKALGISRGSGGIPAWRVNARDNVSSVKHGYFSECPLDVQKELRDTRAQLLIARNKKDLGMVEKQIAQANSQEAVVKDCLRMLRITEQVKKKAAESRVGGWAETIADSAVVSFASSVPSSVPSLESVGIGRSALSSAESSEGALDSAQKLRKLEYEARKAVLVSDFEEHGGFLHSHERVLEILADEYEDVLLTPLELEKKLLASVWRWPWLRRELRLLL